jgi:predicted HTH transcriptional regulator
MQNNVMPDIETIIASGEHFRLEMKKAEGGIPESMWESYSAFANSDGGLILLGISEASPHPVVSGVSEAKKKVKLLWDQLNNRQKVSVNILSERSIYIQQRDDKDIIVIDIPRADRRDKPVYINNDLLGGAYRRNAEGDYRCSTAEVKSMLRDQADIPVDSLVIEELKLSDLDMESIVRYRNHFAVLKPTHVWNRLDTNSFLQKTGAAGRAKTGELKPTLAGLLMFGTEDVITTVLPDYFLDYREIYDAGRWSDRVVSNLGEWSGNIYDFFFKVVNKLTSDIKVPFRLRNGIERVNDTPAHVALREALANAVIHADYYGRIGIVVEKRPGTITISNPGIFRPGKVEALEGGISDPRNPNIFKMFTLLNIGERAGSGLSNIQTVWKDLGWTTIWEEKLAQNRVILTVQIELEEKTEETVENATDVTDKVTEKDTKDLEKDAKDLEKDAKDLEKDAKDLEKDTKDLEKDTKDLEKDTKDLEKDLLSQNQLEIMNLIRDNILITQAELSKRIGINEKNIRNNISKLKSKGLLERVGSDKGGYWKITNRFTDNSFS